jgi:hypothetical protein
MEYFGGLNAFGACLLMSLATSLFIAWLYKRKIKKEDGPRKMTKLEKFIAFTSGAIVSMIFYVDPWVDLFLQIIVPR